MVQKLTATQVKNAKASADGKPLKLVDGDGMHLHISAQGFRSWRFRYRLNKIEQTFVIGSYPGMSLSQAREELARARALVREGEHPLERRNAAKLAISVAKADTFRLVAEEYVARKRGDWSAYYLTQQRRMLDSDLYPYIGEVGISKVSIAQMRQAIKRIEDRAASVVAEQTRQLASQIFRYAESHGRCESDPAAKLKGLVMRPKVKHNRSLAPSEITDLLSRLEKAGGNRTTRIAIELLLLTFVRTGELRQARWSEFDFEAAIWRIPKERMKMKVEHLVPLSRQAIKLMTELKQITGSNELLFPNTRRPKCPMTPTTINRALERMGLSGKGTIGFSAHGFRGTASTRLNELGEMPQAIEKQLAHSKKDAVAGSYNHAQHVDYRGEMMQRWADYIDGRRQAPNVDCN